MGENDRKAALFDDWKRELARYQAMVEALRQGQPWIAANPDRTLESLVAAHKAFKDAYGIS